MSGSQYDTTVRVTVRDSNSKHSTGWNDDYTLLNRPKDQPLVLRMYEEPTQHPNKTMFTNENVALSNVPGRVADVFNVYVDGKKLGLPVTGGQPQDFGREDATITIESQGKAYGYDVFDREFVRVKIDGNYTGQSNVPSSVQNTADQLLPKNVQYL